MKTCLVSSDFRTVQVKATTLQSAVSWFVGKYKERVIFAEVVDDPATEQIREQFKPLSLKTRKYV